MNEYLWETLRTAANALHWMGKYNECNALILLARLLEGNKIETLEAWKGYVEARESGLPFLRPEVEAFAVAMETELRANDHKGGWKRKHPSDPCPFYSEDCLDRLDEEVSELRKATKETTLAEAADVANFAMMYADIRDALPLVKV
jgi:hypothetical protein